MDIRLPIKGYGPKWERKCSQCGEPFLVWQRTQKRQLCDKCIAENRAKGRGEKRDKKPARKRISTMPKECLRPCHDCKKPTTDYRCPKCHDKWLKEWRVAVDAVCETGWEQMAC